MITMQNVRKKYKDFELELSLEIPEGRITGFVGKNGAGKSTAIKLILGLVKPDAGKICVFGNEGGELPAAVQQKIGAMPRFSVMDESTGKAPYWYSSG